MDLGRFFMQYVCSKSILSRSGVSLLSLLTLTAALSACRPSIDDNLPETAASANPGSVSAADLQDGSVTPAKLSQAYLPLAGGTLTGTLTLSGAPTDSLHAATKAYVDQLSSSVTTSLTQAAPPGATLAFSGSTAPAGWLLCDGSAVSRTTYTALYSAIGSTWGNGDGSTTFNLPDLRGVFLRGTGTHGSLTKANGGAVAGPSLGATQNDQMQGHVHSYTSANTWFYSAPLGGNIGIGPVAYSTSSPSTDGTNGTPRTGDETRPANVGVNYIIKY